LMAFPVSLPDDGLIDIAIMANVGYMLVWDGVSYNVLVFPSRYDRSHERCKGRSQLLESQSAINPAHTIYLWSLCRSNTWKCMHTVLNPWRRMGICQWTASHFLLKNTKSTFTKGWVHFWVFTDITFRHLIPVYLKQSDGFTSRIPPCGCDADVFTLHCLPQLRTCQSKHRYHSVLNTGLPCAS
jgi:hypothetical protein